WPAPAKWENDMTDLLTPQILRRLHTDEFDPVPYDARQGAVARTASERLPDLARRLNVALAPFAYDRRATALSLELLNTALGERFYELERDAATDEAAAAASFARRAPVIDVQTHIIDEKLW